jgi:hypothetical protein
MMDEREPTPAASDPLFGLVRERYGARLTEAQLEEVRKGVDAVEQAARVLRAIRLDNADEPMPPFAPYRADG